MEIKFWDEEKQEYINKHRNLLFVDENKRVYELNGADYYGDPTIGLVAWVEPHFYLNGERVA